MAIQSWQNIIDAIKNGEAVTAEVTNRAIYQLAQRTEHLKTRQDAQDYAQALFISDAPLREDVMTGNAVYFDTVSLKFAPAYAELVYKDGSLTMSESGTVVGLVVYKDTTNSGVIVVEGLIDPTNYTGNDCYGEDMTVNMLVDQDARGLLYLNAGSTTAGKMVSTPGLLNIPICNLLDSNHLLVRPPISSTLDTQALRFPLVARPASAELVLRRCSAGAYENFSGTLIPVGSEVSLVSLAVPAGEGDSAVNTYLKAKVHKMDASSNYIQLKQVELTNYCILQLSETDPTADPSQIFKALSGQELVLRITGSVTNYRVSYNTPTLTSYVPIVKTYSGNDPGYVIDTDYIDLSLPGWLPATQQYFPNTVIPVGAKYGYNFDADTNLNQLFPEGVVSAYVIFKDGLAVPYTTAATTNNGIWWFDGINELPWHKVGTGSTTRHVLPDTNVKYSDWTLSTQNSFIPPTDMTLVYAKLVSGGIKVVTSLETTEGSPISIVDPSGNPATTGPLVIKAGFTVTDASSTTAGSLVVKDITGFAMKRGRVVERLVAGDNIALSSTFAPGQGEITVSVTGLDGKLEGSPDILAIDDVLIEKDPTLNIFYSVMPAGKTSSIIGKVDVPQYLAGNYKLQLVITFLALQTTGNIIFSSLPLTWVSTKAPPTSTTGNTTGNLFTGDYAATTGEYPGGVILFANVPVVPKSYRLETVDLTSSVYAGGAIFFKLIRSSNNGDTGKLGIISIRHKFVKI